MSSIEYITGQHDERVKEKKEKTLPWQQGIIQKPLTKREDTNYCGLKNRIITNIRNIAITRNYKWKNEDEIQDYI